MESSNFEKLSVKTRDKKRAKKAVKVLNRKKRKLRNAERRQNYRLEISAATKTKVWRKYGDICYLCGENRADTIDHVIPLVKGGTNGIENLRPTHKKCNQEKGKKIVILPEELEEIGW